MEEHPLWLYILRLSTGTNARLQFLSPSRLNYILFQVLLGCLVFNQSAPRALTMIVSFEALMGLCISSTTGNH